MMNKMEHFLTHFQTRLQTHWNKPSLTDYYGGADYTLGQVATQMRRIEMLMDLMDVKQGDTMALIKGALGYKHLIFGVIAIFFYVGVEVGIPGEMIFYLNSLNIPNATAIAGSIAAIYWLLMLVGRYKKQIEKNVKTLSDWLLKPDHKNALKHIPGELQSTVRDFIASINFASARQLGGGAATQKDMRYLSNLERLHQIIQCVVIIISV